MAFKIKQEVLDNNTKAACTPVSVGEAIKVYREDANGNIIKDSWDEGLILSTNVEDENDRIKANTPYYFSFSIKNIGTSQTFNIFLVKDKGRQFIKKITINPIDKMYHSFEICFKALMDADMILFEKVDPKVPYVVIYHELNAIEHNLEQDAKKIRKLGVQSKPNFTFFINGEPLNTGSTGLYEVRSNIYINSFGAIGYTKGAIENDIKEITNTCVCLFEKHAQEDKDIKGECLVDMIYEE